MKHIYLGILQADDIKHTQVKKKTLSEYNERVRKLLKPRLNGGSIIKATNSWAVPLVRYTAEITGYKLSWRILIERSGNSNQLTMLCILRVTWTDLISLGKLAEEDHFKSNRQLRKKSEHLMIILKTAQNTLRN